MLFISTASHDSDNSYGNGGRSQLLVYDLELDP